MNNPIEEDIMQIHISHLKNEICILENVLHELHAITDDYEYYAYFQKKLTLKTKELNAIKYN